MIENNLRTYPTPILTASATKEVHAALEQYFVALQNSGLSRRSQAIYLDMANNFVRRMAGDFMPGSRVAPYAIKKRETKAS
jgi:hypothetical protein